MPSNSASNAQPCPTCTQPLCVLSKLLAAHMQELHTALAQADELLAALIPHARLRGQPEYDNDITRAYVSRSDVEIWRRANSHLIVSSTSTSTSTEQ